MSGAAEKDRPRVGVSTCLLGENVRHDGGHKRDRFLTEILGEYFQWVPVCPEVEIGLGTPREPIRLVRSEGGPRLVAPKSGRDLTETMKKYAEAKLGALEKMNLRGYILKSNSPSCGMERVRVYDGNGVPNRDGVGLFAASLMERFPNLPVEEEGRLQDARLRENFIGRVFTYDRWRSFIEQGPSPGGLVEFHARHKMLLLAHSPKALQSLGRLVSQSGSRPLGTLLESYESELMQALRAVAKPVWHVNVLQHLAGFLKHNLGPAEKAELHGVIEDYRQGWVPLVAPLTLLQHHLKRLGHSWVDAQVYLEPYPRSLALRGKV